MKKTMFNLMIVLLLMQLSFSNVIPIQSSTNSHQHTQNSPSSYPAINIQPTKADENEWVIECVECPKQFEGIVGDHFMQLDAEGHPRVAYGGENLYYTWYDGENWHYETVDSSPQVGESASLDLDNNGYPHISYLDRKNNYLLYAFQDENGWHLQTVDDIGDVGWFTSIAVDKQGNPHIGYTNNNNNGPDLKYAYKDSDGWHTSVIDQDISDRLSIAVDEVGRPRISYFGGENNNLRYIYWENTGWHIQTVDSDAFINNNVSMVMDAEGKPQIAYCSTGGGELKYAVQDTDGWHNELTGIGYCGNISLALDPEDNPRISHIYAVNNDLMYTYKDSAGWQHQYVANMAGAVIYGMSLNLDSGGIPYLFYSEKGAGILTFQWTADGWTFQVVDPVGFIFNSAMVMDKSDKPHISYIKQAWPDAFVYTYKDTTGWNKMVVEVGEGYDYYQGPFLNLDQGGQPHIIYKQDTYKYVYKDGLDWNHLALPVGDAAVLSFVLDELDRAHITYYEDDTLKYAYYDSRNWQITNATYCETLGQGTPFPVFGCKGGTLALDSSGNPHIVFHRLEPLSMKFFIEYTHKVSSGWQAQQLEFTSGANPERIYLTIDEYDSVHISYNQDRLIKYLFQDSTGWQQETVNIMSQILSLVLDIHGNPHILSTSIAGTYEEVPCKLIYNYRTETGWQAEQLEFYSCNASLTLDKKNNPHISIASEDLYYAQKRAVLTKLFIPWINK